MKHNNLLFSKRQKSDKGTSMGDDSDNIKGVFGVSQGASKDANEKNKNTKEGKETAEKKGKTNEAQIQKVANDYLKKSSPDTLEDMQKETKRLRGRLEILKKEINKEREESINIIKEKDEILKKTNVKVKKLSDEFNQKIEVLKQYEDSLVIKTKKRSRDEIKSQEEVEKEIKLVDAQIQIFEKRALKCKSDYQLSKRIAKIKEKQGNELQEQLTELNEEISTLNEDIKKLKETDVIHKHCKLNNQKIIDEFKAVNKAYEYEIKMAKILALNEIAEEKDLKDPKDNEIEEEADNQEKALMEEKNVLPIIHNLKFNPETDAALEAKIIRKNKVGVKHNKSNSTYLYKQVSKEFNNSEKHIIEANKYIRINQSNGNLKTEGNYLFNDYESNILKKILPQKMINNYQEKFNTILKQKNELREKFKNESCDMKNGNILLNNKKDFNSLQIKETNRRNAMLNLQYHKIEEKVNIMKKNIKDIQRLIQREDDKLRKSEKEGKRIEIYFKGFSGKKKKTKKPINET